MTTTFSITKSGDSFLIEISGDGNDMKLSLTSEEAVGMAQRIQLLNEPDLTDKLAALDNAVSANQPPGAYQQLAEDAADIIRSLLPKP